MREITYRDLLVNDLQKMRSWEFAVDQMTEELRTLDEEYATIKATDYDKMPGESGEIDMSDYHYCPNCGAKMEDDDDGRA